MNRILSWLSAHPRGTLALLVLATLGPFLAKPFNIDDPLFVWLARQVQAHPGDPFGFFVNWYGFAGPMWEATENPPLAGYYFALVADLFGWNEFGFHCAGLLSSLAAVLGTYQLALRFCSHPLLAACAALFTPVFLVSANTVMCDMPLLALWVWAVFFWVEGLEQNSLAKIICSGLLVALAILTKYYGVALIPLLAVYGVMQRRAGVWIVGLLIPLLTLGMYHWFMRSRYGHDLFFDAFHYSADTQRDYEFAKLTRGLIALAFTGGGVTSAFFVAPFLLRKRALVFLIAGTVMVGLVLCFSGIVLQKYPVLKDPAARNWVEAQLLFWAVGGVLIMALATLDIMKNPRDHRAWLLLLWVAGTFTFAAFCNWTVNGRSILPLVPAVGILIARQWERNGPKYARVLLICMVASALLALSVAWSDFQLASAVRHSAQEVAAKYQQPGKNMMFEGHWGFQFYMQELGAHPVDYKSSVPSAGDILVVPWHNIFVVAPGPSVANHLGDISVRNPSGVTTWNKAVGAAFYSSLAGPLPFAFDVPQPENVAVFEIKAGGVK